MCVSVCVCVCVRVCVYVCVCVCVPGVLSDLNSHHVMAQLDPGQVYSTSW